jgi:hypothetical protein
VSFFLLLALNSYIGYVHRPRAWLLVLTYLLTIWAIQSKEMGYAAPVLLLCCEICLAIPAAGPPLWPSCRKALLRIAPTAVFAGIGTIGMLVGSDVMFRLPGYTPSTTGS